MLLNDHLLHNVNLYVYVSLLFADDCFMFFRAEEAQAHIIKEILLKYEAVSGQSISLAKSKNFYSRNVAENLKNAITHILGVRAFLGT